MIISYIVWVWQNVWKVNQHGVLTSGWKCQLVIGISLSSQPINDLSSNIHLLHYAITLPFIIFSVAIQWLHTRVRESPLLMISLIFLITSVALRCILSCDFQYALLKRKYFVNLIDVLINCNCSTNKNLEKPWHYALNMIK